MLRSHVALVALCASSLVGCGATLRAGRPLTVPGGVLEVPERAAERCVHGSLGRDSPFREELPGPERDPELVAYLEPLDAGVRRTAVAAGLEPLLARLLRERQRVASGSSADRLLALRDELGGRMFSLETQLLAMEFEVDCVRTLLDAAASEYQEAETDRQLALTIASLVVGAGTGVASALWDIANNHTETPAWPDGPIVTGIVGAVATTALGVAVLVPEPAELVYVHEHNVLWPLVIGEDEAMLFPTFVFRMLAMPRADGSRSPRDELLEVFEQMFEDVVEAGERELAREIVFGGGGTYDARLLALHEGLLEELGATLDALAGDIDVLGATIAGLFRVDLLEEGPDSTGPPTTSADASETGETTTATPEAALDVHPAPAE